ncbi:MAG: NAD-binding protein [Bacilli bacterium]
MTIVIANGGHEADYIIKMFNNKKNKIIVINSDEGMCSYLATSDKISVIHGNPTKKYDLSVANIDNADVFVALSSNDIDNYVACKMAKKIFKVKKTIAIVRNPKNVSVFKSLGIDAAISGTYLLAESIKSETTIESLIKTLSLEENKIILTEIVVKEKYAVANKTLAEIHFPSTANISCIYRNPNVIIPSGKTVIRPDDRLLIVTTPNRQEEIQEFIQEGK